MGKKKNAAQGGSKKKARSGRIEVESDDFSENLVHLVGRCSTPAVEKALPSGDKVAEFRIVVKRDDREGFDTFDITFWKSDLRRRALTLKADEWIRVSGVLRRRFWRAGSVAQSRWQVEGRELNRI